MKWRVKHQDDPRIILTEVSGNVTLEGIRELLRERSELSKQSGVRFFISDYRNVTLGVSVAEVHRLPHTLQGLGLIESNDKIAVLYSDNPLQSHYFTFFDTMCLLSPLHIRAFTDYDDAHGWLISEMLS